MHRCPHGSAAPHAPPHPPPAAAGGQGPRWQGRRHGWAPHASGLPHTSAHTTPPAAAAAAHVVATSRCPPAHRSVTAAAHGGHPPTPPGWHGCGAGAGCPHARAAAPPPTSHGWGHGTGPAVQGAEPLAVRPQAQTRGAEAQGGQGPGWQTASHA